MLQCVREFNSGVRQSLCCSYLAITVNKQLFIFYDKFYVLATSLFLHRVSITVNIHTTLMIFCRLPYSELFSLVANFPEWRVLALAEIFLI